MVKNSTRLVYQFLIQWESQLALRWSRFYPIASIFNPELIPWSARVEKTTNQAKIQCYLIAYAQLFD